MAELLGTGFIDLKGTLVFVPYNGKVADISEADTDKHFLDLEAALSETRKIVMLIVNPLRITGTGEFRIYPNEGAIDVTCRHDNRDVYSIVVKDGAQRLQYAQKAANDDWDMYCFGYVVEA